jgi:hypothetical protein
MKRANSANRLKEKQKMACPRTPPQAVGIVSQMLFTLFKLENILVNFKFDHILATPQPSLNGARPWVFLL